MVGLGVFLIVVICVQAIRDTFIWRDLGARRNDGRTRQADKESYRNTSTRDQD